MRIATYNIWNDNASLERRLTQLIDEITAVDADVIGLQEVPSWFYRRALPMLAQYPHAAYHTYTGEDEGLAILSKYPIDACTFLHTDASYDNSDALHVLLRAGETTLSITNVHLPWDSIKAKEAQIVAINRFLGTQRERADFFLLLGDFNCGTNASVHRFLVGDQTLLGYEAKPVWQDVAGNFAALHHLSFPPTLDRINNPRWKGQNTTTPGENYDRIYMLDNRRPYEFCHAAVFGTDVRPNGLCASDHYGVLADIAFGR